MVSDVKVRVGGKAARRVVLEVPEWVDEESLQRILRALMFLVASHRLSKLIDEQDAGELARALEEALWRRLQS